MVPNSGGLRGMDVAAVLGIVGGDPDQELAVLERVTQEDIDELKSVFDTFLIEILGIRPEIAGGADNAEAMKPFEKAMDLILEMRAKAKSAKDWATSDLIRDRLAEAGFTIKDTKDGAEWSVS